jgi:hypothetical protein
VLGEYVKLRVRGRESMIQLLPADFLVTVICRRPGALHFDATATLLSGIEKTYYQSSNSLDINMDMIQGCK